MGRHSDPIKTTVRQTPMPTRMPISACGSLLHTYLSVQPLNPDNMKISKKKELLFCLFMDKNDRTITHILGIVSTIIVLVIHEIYIFPAVLSSNLGIFSHTRDKLPTILLFIFLNFVISEHLYRKDRKRNEKNLRETMRQLEELEMLEKNQKDT